MEKEKQLEIVMGKIRTPPHSITMQGKVYLFSTQFLLLLLENVDNGKRRN